MSLQLPIKKVLYQTKNLSVALEGRWVFVNDKKYGFATAEGLYCHKKLFEVFHREYGFYVPGVLLHYTHTFEVQIPKGVAVWFYSPKMRQRMLNSAPQIFVSVARMVRLEKAHHVPRPRK